MDEGVFNKIFSAATGVWTIAAMVAVGLFRMWPLLLGRLNERRRDNASERAGDWDRIRAERDNARAERDRIHALWVECEEDKMMLLARAITAESALVGMGVARQQVTILKGVMERPEGGGNGGK